MHKARAVVALLGLTIGFTVGVVPARAQAPAIVMLPPDSPAASVTQTLGLTTLSVSYHRPSVKGRAIWGGLEPYDSVWRAGANQNTVLTSSSAFTVGGTSLPAGRYAVHMIPTKTTWTVILSRQANAWGSFSYAKGEDAARTTVTPRATELAEQLQYTFDAIVDSTALLTMRWERLAVTVPITINVTRVVMDSLTQQYRGMPRFWPQAWLEGARWALSHNAPMAVAEAWADTSLQMQVTFAALRTKAAIQERRGNIDGATSLRAQALAVATQADLEALGFQTLRTGSATEATALFRRTVAEHPRSWRAFEGLGDALVRAGKADEARGNYQKALSLAPESQRARLTQVVAGVR